MANGLAELLSNMAGGVGDFGRGAYDFLKTNPVQVKAPGFNFSNAPLIEQTLKEEEKRKQSEAINTLAGLLGERSEAPKTSISTQGQPTKTGMAPPVRIGTDISQQFRGLTDVGVDPLKAYTLPFEIKKLQADIEKTRRAPIPGAMSWGKATNYAFTRMSDAEAKLAESPRLLNAVIQEVNKDKKLRPFEKQYIIGKLRNDSIMQGIYNSALGLTTPK